MSDQVTAPVVEPTPAAPVAPQPAEPAAQPQVSGRESAKRAARQGMHADAATADALAAVRAVINGETPAAEAGTAVAPEPTQVAAPTAPATDEASKARDEKGRFVSTKDGGDAGQQTDAAAAAAAEGAHTTPAATPGVSGEGTEGGAADAAPGIRIDVPEDHFIRQSGRDHFIARDEAERRDIQAMLNATGMRRAEVENLTQQNAELERELAEIRRAQIRVEATEAATAEWTKMPQYQALRAQYFEIKETSGPEAASRFWRGAQAELQPIVDRELQTREAAFEAEHEARIRKNWESEAKLRTGALPAHIRSLPQLDQWVDEELVSFRVRAERGHFEQELARIPEEGRREWLHKQFMQQFARRLKVEPAVREAASRQQQSTERPLSKEEYQAALEKARQEGAEKLRQEMARSRQAIPPNPLAGDGAGVDAGTVSGEEETPDFSTMTAAEIKRYHRAGARQDARALIGT